MPSDEWRAELKRQLDEAADAIMFLDEEGTVERDWSVDDVVSVAVDVALKFAERQHEAAFKRAAIELDGMLDGAKGALDALRLVNEWTRAHGVLDRREQPPGESRCGTCDNSGIVKQHGWHVYCPDAFHRPPQRENSLIDDEQTNAQMERAIASAIHEQDDPPEVLNVRRPPTCPSCGSNDPRRYDEKCWRLSDHVFHRCKKHDRVHPCPKCPPTRDEQLKESAKFWERGGFDKKERSRD